MREAWEQERDEAPTAEERELARRWQVQQNGPAAAREGASEPRTAPEASPDAPERVTARPGPAEPERPPLVIDLNMNRVKMREYRAMERILLAVTGEFQPVITELAVMPADHVIALLTHRLLVAERDIDCSRMTERDALVSADLIRETFARAEEYDFDDLTQPPPRAGDGEPPSDPTSAAPGSEQQPSAGETSPSEQPSSPSMAATP